VPKGVLDVVAEDPEIEHVSAKMDESAMKEHGREYCGKVIGQEVVPAHQCDEKLMGHQSIVSIEGTALSGGEGKPLPEKN